MVKDFHNMGMPKRTLLLQIIVVSNGTFEKITNDYMIKSLTKATHILAEYPQE